MDALLSAFAAAALAEWGDRTQLIVALLAARYAKPGAVLAGLFVAAAAGSAVAAVGAILLEGMVTIRAETLLLALALLFAAAAGVLRKAPRGPGSRWRGGAFLAAAILCLAAEMGDRTQFLTFAIAARFDAPWLAAAGASAGILAACIPAALLGARLQAVVPVRAIRLGTAALFLITGFIVAVNALRLT